MLSFFVSPFKILRVLFCLKRGVEQMHVVAYIRQRHQILAYLILVTCFSSFSSKVVLRCRNFFVKKNFIAPAQKTKGIKRLLKYKFKAVIRPINKINVIKAKVLVYM